MKKIMLAAVAASFVSTGASAIQLPAEGEACSTIHSNISVGINNPELSDYRKCVMIQHDIDTAFTYKTFWVRNGDTFTSFPVETLAKMNRAERIDYMLLAIKRGAAIDALTAERDALEDERDMLVDSLTTAGLNLDKALLDLADVNKTLGDLNKALDEIDRTNAKVEIVFQAGAASVTPEDGHHSTLYRDNLGNVTVAHADGTSTSFKIEDGASHADVNAAFNKAITDVESAVILDQDGNYNFNGVTISVDLNADGTVNYVEVTGIESLISQYSTHTPPESAAADLERNEVVGAVLTLGNLFLTIDQINEIGDMTDEIKQVETVLNAIKALVATPKTLGTDPYMTYDGGAASAHREELIDGITTLSSPIAGQLSTLDDGAYRRFNRTYIVVDGQVVGGISANSSRFQGINGVIEAHIDGWTEGFEAGYTKGFNDGYDEGYTDGYRDGFRDGVQSTQ